jgi:hypothetical protein
MTAGGDIDPASSSAAGIHAGQGALDRGCIVPIQLAHYQSL